MGVTLDFRHVALRASDALLWRRPRRFLDDLLELVEEHDQRPPATRPFDCVHGAESR